MSDKTDSKESTLLRLYHTMQEHLHDALEAEQNAVSSLKQLVENAKQKVADLNEYTHEEIERIGDYLHRDLEDAGTYISETGEDLGLWLHMEEELIEDRFKSLLLQAGDPTRIALTKLDQEAHHVYHSGEVVCMGRFTCNACECEVQFNEPSILPKCPQCGATEFHRTPIR